LSQWIVPYSVLLEFTVSMMSISPHAGQATPLLRLVPSIQNAGHMPCPSGTCMRPSMCPYGPKLPVLMRADVYGMPPTLCTRA